MHAKQTILVITALLVSVYANTIPRIHAQSDDCRGYIGGPELDSTVVILPDSFEVSVKLYEQPNKESSVVATLVDGDLLDVVGGPQCPAKGEVWWQLVGASGLKGWILQDRSAHVLVGGGLSDRINSTAFTPDGKYVLIGSADNRTRLWNVQTGKKEGRIIGGQSVAVSPDGKHIVTGGYTTVQLWDRQSLKEIRQFDGHQAYVNSVAFSSDGRYLLTGSGDQESTDGTARLWEVNTGKKILTFTFEYPAWVTSVAFTPDGKQALIVAEGEGVRLYDVTTGQTVRDFGDASLVTRAVLSQDGKQILTSNYDAPVMLWDAQTGAKLRVLNVGADTTTPLAISPDGSLAVIGAPRGQAKSWNIKTGKLIRSFTIKASEVTGVNFSPDGKWVIISTADNAHPYYPTNIAWLCDVNTGKVIQSFRAYKER
ncbi:MAG: WD40 repeat domain-containing protein [Anaerolineae bacterium]|nr:WD40 repeat domain-containing protein [Anaerolineae bacterium]